MPMPLLGRCGAMWGIGGTVLVLSESIGRLSHHAWEAMTSGLSAGSWAALVGWTLFMMIVEGYRGFQRAFSPRVVARAWHLGRSPNLLHALLAPLYCMSLIHASRRRLVGSWVVVGSIFGLAVFVRTLEQPARGIIDAGVVAGLMWGLLSVLAFTVRALQGRPPAVSLELPVK